MPRMRNPSRIKTRAAENSGYFKLTHYPRFRIVKCGRQRFGEMCWRWKLRRASFPLEYGFGYAHRRQGPLFTAVSKIPSRVRLG